MPSCSPLDIRFHSTSDEKGIVIALPSVVWWQTGANTNAYNILNLCIVVVVQKLLLYIIESIKKRQEIDFQILAVIGVTLPVLELMGTNLDARVVEITNTVLRNLNVN